MRDHLALSLGALPALALVLMMATPCGAAPRDPVPAVDGLRVGPRPTAPVAPPVGTPGKKKAAKAGAAAAAEAAKPALPPPAEAVAQARTLLDGGQAAQAEALLRPYLEAPPVDVDVRATLAAALSDQSKDAEAAAQLEQVVHARPDDDDARLRLADLYVGMDEADSALEHYQAVLARRPNDPALRRRTGLLLVDLDRGAEAIPHLEAVSALVPGDEEVLGVLEKLYRWNDRPDMAQKILEQRVRQHPDDTDAARELAERFLDRGDEPRAIALYERVVAARPDDLDARRALGELYEWNGAPHKALAQYDAYLEARPYDTEVRARSLSISSDLGLGPEARRHGYLLRSTDPRFQSAARESILADTGFGSWAGVEYDLFHEKGRVLRQQVGPRAQYQINDLATVGLWYQFRHLRGPANLPNAPTRTVMGHAVGAFTKLSLPLEFELSFGASFAHYDTGFDSGNGFLTLSRDFGPATLTFQAERGDLMTSVGDLRTKVVANDLTLGVDAEPVDRFLLHASGTWGMYADRNQRLATTLGAGWRPLDSPRIEIWYEYQYDHFKYPSAAYPKLTYFAPRNYQSHGPLVSLVHAATPWFAYGLDLHLWHVYDSGDQELHLQYGAQVIFRPGLHHRIQASYQRTDSVWGTTSARYVDNQGMFTYAYEF